MIQARKRCWWRGKREIGGIMSSIDTSSSCLVTKKNRTHGHKLHFLLVLQRETCDDRRRVWFFYIFKLATVGNSQRVTPPPLPFLQPCQVSSYHRGHLQQMIQFWLGRKNLKGSSGGGGGSAQHSTTPTSFLQCGARTNKSGHQKHI